MLRRVVAFSAGALSLVLGLVACENSWEPPTDAGKDYYPLAVGAERVFNVEDKVWRNNVVTSTTTSQLREQITDSYRDATGALTYKVVRSSRATASAGWRVDTVQTLTVNDRNLLLTRSNLRTVELVFPVHEGVEWNKNAFNTLDTIIAVNRRLQDVGSSLTVGSRTYENTATAYDEVQDNAIYLDVQRQVYAKGVGPVLREVRRLNYCQDSRTCSVGTDYIVTGTEHRETLVN